MSYVALPRHTTQTSTLSELTHVFSDLKAGIDRSHRLVHQLVAQPRDKPTLIFDLSEIEDKMQQLRLTAKKNDAEVLVAVKSAANPAYLETAKQQLDGFDVSNLREYEAIPGDLTGRLVSLTSPMMDANLSEFQAKRNELLVTVDSEQQWQQIERSAHRPAYLLRVQTSGLLGEFEEPSRFGYTRDQALLHIRNPLRAPSGFHLHHGGESNSGETYKQLIQALKQMAEERSFQLDILNLGGGWHLLNPAEIHNVLTFARELLPKSRILLEPGRYFTQGCGFASGNIVNRHEHDDIISYTLDLSAQCHLRWSSPRLVCPVSKAARQLKEVRFYGPTCYEWDCIGTFLVPFKNDLENESGLSIGKPVIFSDVNAYSSALNSTFNGIEAASVEWEA